MIALTPEGRGAGNSGEQRIIDAAYLSSGLEFPEFARLYLEGWLDGYELRVTQVQDVYATIRHVGTPYSRTEVFQFIARTRRVKPATNTEP